MKYVQGKDWKEKSNWNHLQDYTTTLRDNVIDQVKRIQPPYTDGDTVTS